MDQKVDQATDGQTRAALNVPHYGTTLMEDAPKKGAKQKDVPFTGMLKKTDTFLKLLGMECYIENMYPDVGRQYIYRRGNLSDPDYLEKDSFTSYRAVERPESKNPRVGDTFFRLTHRDPVGIYKEALKKKLITCLLGKDQEKAFLGGKQDGILIMGPDLQRYELTSTKPLRHQNNAVFVWTRSLDVAPGQQDFKKHFNLTSTSVKDFYGIADVVTMERKDPEIGITVGLIAPVRGAFIDERWTDDIFLEAGYSHFRLGALNKRFTKRASKQAFPDGGDVSFVYFRDSYLELVAV